MAGRGTDIVLGGNPVFLARSKSKKGEGTEEYAQLLEELKQQSEEERGKVLEAGGLHILGTERHESRRIDNQLRGRSGRQGDPGSSRFYLSLEDDLMRIFGGERVKMIMERVGMEDGEPIEHKYTTRAIENAQKKVEAHNFDIRKHLLEFDDVMNKQREVVYSQRRFILGGEDLKGTIQDMIEDLVGEMVGRFTDDHPHYDDWDIAALVEALWGQFGIRFHLDSLPPEGKTVEGVTEHIQQEVIAAYERKEQELTPEVMRELEKYVMLQSVDNQWKDHLLSMDHLKEGIGLRGYGQRDPLKEYQREGYEIFLDMSNRIKEETVRNLFLVRIAAADDLEELAPSREQEMVLSHGDSGGDSRPKTVRRQTEKIGRNDPCPCGSGKKYKKCCGKAA
jgi:preprotein translocase subunit SecA